MRSKLRRAVIPLGGVTIAAAVGFGAMTIAGFGTSESEQLPEASPSPSQTEAVPGNVQITNTVLWTSNRDHLAFCVQSIGATDEVADVAVAAIVENWPTVASNPRWQWAGAPNTLPEIDVGCPSAPAYFSENSGPRHGDSFFLTQGNTVTTPSIYNVFIFIMPQNEIDSATQGGTRVASQERMCEGHVCWEVTAGLYLGESDLDNAPFLIDEIEDAIGLE